MDYKKEIKLPVLSLTTIALGLSIGYCEGKGIETGNTFEYLAKFGPITFALVAEPALMYMTTRFNRQMIRKMKETKSKLDLENKLSGRMKRLYQRKSEFDYKIIQKSEENIKNLEEGLRDPKYFRRTAIEGIKIAVETTASYYTGRFFSHIF